jgi:hypothetical protein
MTESHCSKLLLAYDCSLACVMPGQGMAHCADRGLNPVWKPLSTCDGGLTSVMLAEGWLILSDHWLSFHA